MRSELDEALFSATEPVDAPVPVARPDEPDLSNLDDELFGEPTAAPDVTAPTSVEPEPDLEFAAEPIAESTHRPASESSVAADDSTAVFGSVPIEEAGGVRALSRRQRQRGGDEGGSGRAKRLGLAALVVFMIAGVGGLAYAALGRTGDDSSPKEPKVEVQGTEVTRTTVRSTTTSTASSSTSTATTKATTSTSGAPTSTTRRRATATPEPEAPVVEPPPPDAPPPPGTEPPPTTPTIPPTLPPTLPPTTAPPTTEPPTTTEPPPVTVGGAPSAR